MIPDYQTIMLPILKFLKDGNERSIQEVTDNISNLYNLTEEEQRAVLPSGHQPIIDNRVGWARTYMKKAGLLESPRRAYVKITNKGLETLRQNPVRIDINFLSQFPEFIEFRTRRVSAESEPSPLIEQELNIRERTPDELMEDGYKIILEELGHDLLERVRNTTPAFFESIVLQLLSNMGYGHGEVTGRSGDGGIDGIVNQDKLGLDKIFFQAKRFGETTPVTASMLRDFVGTLELRGANKGVFITASKFPTNAGQTIRGSHKSIILIDGSRLVQLMIDYNVGVNSHKLYEIKRIDSDFFSED